MAPGRLIFDISSVARWAGPPIGIIRVERQLLTAALASRPDIVSAVFDPDLGRYRTLRPEWQETILGHDGAVVLSDGPALARRGWHRLVPRPGDVLFAMERLRLTTRHAWLASLTDRAERLAARTKRHSIQLFSPSGQRFAYVPGSLALGDALPLHATDTVLAVGYDWLRKSPAQVARLKATTGIRYVVTCYDMIPLLQPQYYAAAEVEGFRRYWSEILPIADAVIAISNHTRAALKDWADQQRVPIRSVVTVPLASSMGAADAEMDASLPAGLSAGRYVLMVGTVEPRKGHQLMLDTWRALMALGIPQRCGFSLVFVGRRGWHTESLLDDIAAASGPHLMHLSEVWDSRLERLYHDAAFCVLPSATEGYGLPVVEALAHGKAIITSTGGALPEVVGDFSPCLDVSDGAAWQRMMQEWIEDASARRPYEERIRDHFTPRTWAAVAEDFWCAALEGADPCR